MVDTTTTVLGLVKQTIGGNRNTWGAILNAAMDTIEGAFYGMTSKVVTGSGDVTLTDSERRKRIIVLTGTLAADQNIVVANLVGRWTVRNGTAGNYKVKFKTPTGTAVEIPAGNCSVWCDGQDNFYADLSTRLRDVQMTVADGTDDVPGYSFKNETNSGWRRVSLGLFAFVVGGVRIVTIAGTALRVAISDAGAAITGDLSVSGSISCTGLTIGGTAPVPIGMGADYDGIREPAGWKFRNGQALDRTTYALLLNVLTETATGTRTNGNNVLTGVSKDLTDLGLEGAIIEGSAGIASGTTITAITSTTITLSGNASGNGSINLRIFPHGNGDGATTFNTPDDKGRVTAGRDNMGGTAASRLTGLSGGVDGAKLGKAGGEQATTLTIAQMPAHDHPGSTASVTDPGHKHNLPGTVRQAGSNAAGGDGGAAGSGATFSDTQTATTGISVTPTIASHGGSGAHNSVQPTRITNKIIFTGVFV